MPNPRQRSTLGPLAIACSAVVIGALASRAPGLALDEADTRGATRAASADARDQGLGPGPALVDRFHPDHQPGPDGNRPPLPAPAYGGRARIQIEVMPPGLNFAIESSATARRILYEVHETLMRVDPETWEWTRNLCSERIVEDTLWLTDGGRLYGRVSEDADGYSLEPLSVGNPTAETRRVPIDAVRALERATVYTYTLRDDVVWHPSEGARGHLFDSGDMAFSLSIYANPDVRCGAKREKYREIEWEVLDERSLRVFLPRQHFRADEPVGYLTILPAHLYDLSDPDNPDHDPQATPQEQARYINENAHNLEWVGLGCYRVVEFSSQYVEAERFADYYDPHRGGYLDTIRWRYVPDAALFSALLNDELDFTARLSTNDFFGQPTRRESFSEHFYQGYYYGSLYGALVWNLYRPELAERDVRRALAHAFDFEGFRVSVYRGLAQQVTGPMPFFSDAYDQDIEPLAFDPPRAERLLDEAGWYDRDGDGVRDKDGVALEIEYLMPTGSASSRTLGLKLQEDFARVGVAVEMRDLEWTAFRERQIRRDFDATPVAWYPPLEPDPENLWHSKNGARDVESSNHSGLCDAEVDRLIGRGRVEMDRARRMEIWRELHARLYDLQPYLFLYNVPVKFALRRDLRGFQAVAVDPYYVVRRWYYPVGTPGTREAR